MASSTICVHVSSQAGVSDGLVWLQSAHLHVEAHTVLEDLIRAAIETERVNAVAQLERKSEGCAFWYV
jgi:hypothetical protein